MLQKNGQDRIKTRLSNIVRDLIKDAINYGWLKRTGNAEVSVRESNIMGATDAIIFEAEAKLKFFVKFHPSDSRKEKKGYDTLSRSSKEFAQHLVPPLIKGIDEALMLTPYINAITLHELIRTQATSNEWINQLYYDFLQRNRRLWLLTKADSHPDVRSIYIGRIQRRMKLMEQELQTENLPSTKIRVNNTDIGTFRDILSEFETRIGNTRVPLYSCTTHGDEHANNIMVFNDAIGYKIAGWVLIDYVNVNKNTDWVFSIAKMLQWWQFYFVLEEAKISESLKTKLSSSMRLSDNTLDLQYDKQALRSEIPTVCMSLEEQIMELAQTVGQDFGEDPDSWRDRLKLALFSVVFGSIALHFKDADFAVPIMLGESLDILRR